MQERETITEPAWVKALIWAGFPILGAGAGWLLKSIAGWVAGLEWAPFQGPFKLIASIKEPHATIGALALGFLAGLVISVLGHAESLKVIVAADSVELARPWQSPNEVHRSKIDAVFADGKDLVLLAAGGAEIAREKSDLEVTQLQPVFERYGYKWLASDPYQEDFRRWIEDDPAVPGSANALLKVRATAVRKDKPADAAELRKELAKLGVVVKDQKKKQYWRLVTPPPDSIAR
jgi:hypothetical protein